MNRRSALLLLLLGLGGCVTRPEASEFTVRERFDAGGLVPVPLDEQDQEVSVLDFEPRAGTVMTHGGEGTIIEAAGPVVLTFRVVRRPREPLRSRAVGKRLSQAATERLAAWLRPEEDPATSETPVVRASADTPVAAVRQILAHVRSMDGEPARRLATFVNECRSVLVPARQVTGMTLDPTPAPAAWAECYFADYGWVPVDVQDPEADVGQLDARRYVRRKGGDARLPSAVEVLPARP